MTTLLAATYNDFFKKNNKTQTLPIRITWV